jgi:CBS domain-containing protein
MDGDPQENANVRDVMTTSVVTAMPDTSLSSIADLMTERRLRAIPVVDDSGHVLGMITDRSVMSHFLPQLGATEAEIGDRELADLGGVPVREVMDRTVMCVNDDQPLADVAALMLDKEMERLPVVAEGLLVGFLTRGDIIRRLLAQRDRKMSAPHEASPEISDESSDDEDE